MDSVCSSTQANECKTGLNWTELMKAENGGPGESPGRSEAIERALKAIAERYAMNGMKRAKGSKKAVKNELGRPRAKALGL